MQTFNSQLLSPHTYLTHAFTTRYGGVSKAPYQSNNLAFHVEDNQEDVLVNHKRTAKHLNYNYQKLVHMRQIHSDMIIIVDPTIHNFNNPPECDALITDQKNIPLMVMTADCTPVLFFDTKKKVIAVAHAGRAGALKGIVPKTIKQMQNRFGSELTDISVVLGPSIGSCCYEVGEKIAQEVREQGYGLSVVYKNGQYSLDVNAIIRKQLQTLGLSKHNFEDLNICNACHNETFFSYRADRQITGRIAGILMLH